MKYQIIGKNIKITEGISAAVKKKLGKLEKYFLINDEVDCRVVCSSHDKEQKIEVTIFLPQMPIRAEVKHEDLYAAIDLSIDKLEGQMRKIKTRMDRSSRLSLSESIDFEQLIETKEPEEKDTVVRAKSYYLQPMKIDEAILRMQALGHDFFLYLDEEDDRIAVVYNRRDGGYGVIEAENPIK